jgi:6-pyruvoyltetrahydropterin/6-carboxytetrahydropterin synthase
MYHLTILTSFAAAHNLLNYQGDCEKLHGHNWRVEVTVAAADLDKAGLGIDFKILKKHAGEVMDYLDHNYLNNLDAFIGVSPSSEHISRFIFERLKESLADYPVTLDKITVWESDKAYATYTEG